MTTARGNVLRPSVEALEDRQMLAASLIASMSGTVLTITGTENADRIMVRQRSGLITVDGIQISGKSNVAATKVTKIQVWSYGGNDTIRLDRGAGEQDITAAAYVVAGTNNDTIYGGAGKDTLFGEAGDDRIYGGGGDDQMMGGADRDRLFGEIGRDSLWGEGGDDYLDGGADIDYCDGGAGVDTFRRNLNLAGLGLHGQDSEWEVADEPQQVSGAFLTAPTNDSIWHIDQTDSPTCSFLASLASAADWTGRFSNLGSANNDLLNYISYDAASDQYGVRLNVGGQWKTYWVNSDWTETRDPGGPLWVTLYQKAYLKAMDVVYQRADGSWLPSKDWYSSTGKTWKQAGTAMQALTGYTSTYVGIGSADAATMQSNLRGGYMLVAGTKVSGTSSNIVADHAYAVCDVFKVNGAWQVRLYNPWGKDGPTGSADGNDDGMITISWSQFLSNFNGYTRN